MLRFLWLLLIALSTLSAQEIAPAKLGKRYALVVGNGAYSRLPAQSTALAEATLVAAALRDAGFEVAAVTDFVLPDFLVSAEAAFLQRVQPGDICILYFSGYAVQVVDDDNYLLPIDFDPNGALELEKRALRLTRLQQELEERKAGLKIFIVEAQRPFGAPIRSGDDPDRALRAVPGLVNPDLSQSKQTLFSFAAQPGQTSVPVAEGEISPFTQALVRNIGKPGLRLREVFEQVKQEVLRATSQQQIPFVNDNLLGEEFFFHAAEAVVSPETTTTSRPAGSNDETPLGVPFNNSRDRQDYVWVRSGEFKMGCVTALDTKCEAHEKPQHRVTITKGFWMGQTEVTVAAYSRFVDNSGKKVKMPTAPLFNSGWRDRSQPIVNVSWEQANAFCEWVGGRLPTEAEWEYAARGNVDDEVYPLNEENSRDKANYYGQKGNDKSDYAAPVKQFDATPVFKLYDMLGNVWEWVADWYGPNYYADSPASDPRGPEAGKEHVRRGGSFDSDPKQHLRLSFRMPYGKPSNNVGMRCVLADTPETRKLLHR